MKKILAIFLCLVMLLASLSGCANKEPENEGAQIKMYISEPVYNFDPAEAYKNESALKMVSLLFDNLFVLNSKGEVEKSLVKDYRYNAEDNSMLIELKSNASWSDGKELSANDVVYAWNRILDPANSFEAAVLLYDIKNARAVKSGDVTVDDLGVSALNKTELKILFENDSVDYKSFINKLTSHALAPLREDVVSGVEVANDWAKSPLILVASGPFRLKSVSYAPETAGVTLERNSYYYRDFMKDPVDKSVTPFRIIVDYTKNGEEILSAYENGEIFFIGDIPLSARSKYTLEEWNKKANVTDALSTHTYVLNEHAEINGEKIFANKNVRNALSLAIDRESIAAKVVFAEAATGIVPNGVFNENNAKKTFRNASNDKIATNANKDLALAKLSEANITPSKYTFEISVPSYDAVHIAIAEEVAKAWCGLGFNVTVKKIELVDNADKAISTKEKITGIKDDKFIEALAAGDFQVAAIDSVAFSADPFSVLAPYAFGFSGSATSHKQSPDFNIKPHISGYNESAYTSKIEAAYNENNSANRATLLHEAEAILIDDMPIIPIVFNKSVSMQSEELSKISSTYYQTYIFTKTKQKNYEQYLPA